MINLKTIEKYFSEIYGSDIYGNINNYKTDSYSLPTDIKIELSPSEILDILRDIERRENIR